MKKEEEAHRGWGRGGPPRRAPGMAPRASRNSRGHHRAPPRRPLMGEGCRQAERHRAPHPHRRPVGRGRAPTRFARPRPGARRHGAAQGGGAGTSRGTPTRIWAIPPRRKHGAAVHAGNEPFSEAPSQPADPPLRPVHHAEQQAADRHCCGRSWQPSRPPAPRPPRVRFPALPRHTTWILDQRGGADVRLDVGCPPVRIEQPLVKHAASRHIVRRETYASDCRECIQRTGSPNGQSVRRVHFWRNVVTNVDTRTG